MDKLNITLIHLLMKDRSSIPFCDSWVMWTNWTLTKPLIDYPAVGRERFGAFGGFIFPIFPIQWGAKELLRVSQPFNSRWPPFWLMCFDDIFFTAEVLHQQSRCRGQAWKIGTVICFHHGIKIFGYRYWYDHYWDIVPIICHRYLS